MAERSYLRTHTLQAEHLVLDLGEASATLEALRGTADRHGVTLVRESGLSLVLTRLEAGAVLQEHAAPGPATVQVIDGEVRVQIGDAAFAAPAGRLVAFDAGVRHRVEAVRDSTLLLTLAARHDA